MNASFRPALSLLVVAGSILGAGCVTTPPSPVNIPAATREVWASTTSSFGRLETLATTTTPAVVSDARLIHRVPVSYAHELIASANLDVPPGASAWIEARLLGRENASGVTVEQTQWFTLASFGERSAAGGGAVKDGDVYVDVDTLKFPPRYRHAEVRVRSSAPGVVVARLDVTVSSPALRTTLPDTDALCNDGSPLLRGLDLRVPFLSQRTSKKELSGRLCSPTSLAMVLNFHGVACDVESVAAAALDPQHDLYGNWPRNIQSAYERGVEGMLTRFDSWQEVERTLADGLPIIASIFVEEGQLRGAPYSSTDGHLIVIRGMDDKGDLLVNDPAAGTPETGMLTYRRSDMETVWLGNTKGTAYVLYGKAAR